MRGGAPGGRGAVEGGERRRPGPPPPPEGRPFSRPAVEAAFPLLFGGEVAQRRALAGREEARVPAAARADPATFFRDSRSHRFCARRSQLARRRTKPKMRFTANQASRVSKICGLAEAASRTMRKPSA